MQRSSKLPIVAIVGRPNVGKSTLFNRYAGHRRVLVEDTPGVTRDTIAEEVDVEGRHVLLVDTAGLDPQVGDRLSGAVQAHARAAMQDADAILFLVDGRAGLLPEDEALARSLHRTDKPVGLAVNKLDHPKHDAHLGEFQTLGFERCHGVSAEHGRGAWDALEDLVAALPEPEEPPSQEPQAPQARAARRRRAKSPQDSIRIAVVGRPNVGKSSLVNRLVGADRVVVSEVPGTTRDSIDTHIEHEGRAYTIVDTAGLRRPGRRTRTAERGSALMTVRSLQRADVALVVIDAAESATDQDARVANLARERGCACAVLANKWDLVRPEGPERAQEVRDAVRHALRFMGDAPLLSVSAKSGAGMQRIFPLVESVAAAGEREIPTAELNRWLEATVARHEPAMAQRGPRRRPLKFFYATQTAVRPPTFVLFCTEPTAVQPSYRRFLENRLREAFDLEGTPVRLRLRARGRD